MVKQLGATVALNVWQGKDCFGPLWAMLAQDGQFNIATCDPSVEPIQPLNPALAYISP